MGPPVTSKDLMWNFDFVDNRYLELFRVPQVLWNYLFERVLMGVDGVDGVSYEKI